MGQIQCLISQSQINQAMFANRLPWIFLHGGCSFEKREGRRDREKGKWQRQGHQVCSSLLAAHTQGIILTLFACAERTSSCNLLKIFVLLFAKKRFYFESELISVQDVRMRIEFSSFSSFFSGTGKKEMHAKRRRRRKVVSGI